MLRYPLNLKGISSVTLSLKLLIMWT